MQDFAACVREHVKNTGTKPVQSDLGCEEFHQHHQQKNPGSAATETGIKSTVKALSFLRQLTLKSDAKSTDNLGSAPLLGGDA